MKFSRLILATKADEDEHLPRHHHNRMDSMTEDMFGVKEPPLYYKRAIEKIQESDERRQGYHERSGCGCGCRHGYGQHRRTKSEEWTYEKIKEAVLNW